MNLYSIYENGAWRKIKKSDFSKSKVYLIDDFRTIYLWFGSNSSERKREFAKKKAKNLNDRRKVPANIQIIDQGKEYGAFLAIIDVLKKGFPIKREELKIEIEDTLELIDSGLEIDLEAEITLAAHKLSEDKVLYEDLSRQLAEFQLTLLRSSGKPSEKEISKKYNEILKSSATYEELCWLVSELKILVNKEHLKNDG